MGNCMGKSKQIQKEPDKFFERQKQENVAKDKVDIENRRPAIKELPVTPDKLLEPPPVVSASSEPVNTETVCDYDVEALRRMRWQLQNDSEAFLLNNILLSVQFFENYQRETDRIKNKPTSERETLLNKAMVRESKHVFFADRLQECVQEHVYYQRSEGQSEPLSAPRLFVIYDNVEATEPGDTADYTGIFDAPLYKLQIENEKQPGYVKLRKIEVLESALQTEILTPKKSFDSICTDSEKDCNDSDEGPYSGINDDALLQQIKKILHNAESYENNDTFFKPEQIETSAQKYDGRKKRVSLQLSNNIFDSKKIKCDNDALLRDEPMQRHKNLTVSESDTYAMPLPRKSILKNTRRMSTPLNNQPLNIDLRKASSETNVSDATDTSGYISTCSSRQIDSSETESDYNYSTSAVYGTPKKVELSKKNNYYSITSAVLPEDNWTSVEAKSLTDLMEDDDEEFDDDTSNTSMPRYFYLNSLSFMTNFVDNFIINIGSGLGFSHNQINSALTQGASIYCNCLISGTKVGYTIFPAFAANWPNVANQWIIRKRKIIQDPRTNFTYQWPTEYMVNKAVGTGCFLVPMGFGPQNTQNPDQTLQWKLIYPAAERYLESCLAHSHIRCYLFSLALHKTFIENETANVGIDISHIKNHLFWQCEANFAKWPEDRLGESLRLFFRSFYAHIARSRLPNYFMENRNEFEGIPKLVLHKVQRRVADILESPVMFLLCALNKLRYTKSDFYPTFDCKRLYNILTCKDPLRILNPNIPSTVPNYQGTSDSDEGIKEKLEDEAKIQDKEYQLKKKQRQLKEKRRIQIQAEKEMYFKRRDKEMNIGIILPLKMDPIRRRLVLNFFVPHFIAMARSSEMFEDIGQAIIYLNQARRLCLLLMDEAGAHVIANEYLNIIRDKLDDCKQKLVHHGGLQLSSRQENRSKISDHKNSGVPKLVLTDVYVESSESKQLNEARYSEESKL